MILLWDSSNSKVLMTLVDEADGSRDYEWQANRDLAHKMLKFMKDKLQISGSDLYDITGIGVFRGPGSYTGLRIGLTVLNTIANDLKIPIVGSLDANDWQNDCLKKLSKGDDDQVVLPEYGGEAHVTKPRK